MINAPGGAMNALVNARAVRILLWLYSAEVAAALILAGIYKAPVYDWSVLPTTAGVALMAGGIGLITSGGCLIRQIRASGTLRGRALAIALMTNLVSGLLAFLLPRDHAQNRRERDPRRSRGGIPCVATHLARAEGAQPRSHRGSRAGGKLGPGVLHLRPRARLDGGAQPAQPRWPLLQQRRRRSNSGPGHPPGGPPPALSRFSTSASTLRNRHVPPLRGVRPWAPVCPGFGTTSSANPVQPRFRGDIKRSTVSIAPREVGRLFRSL